MKVLKFPKKDSPQQVHTALTNSGENLHHLTDQEKPLSPPLQKAWDQAKSHLERVSRMLEKANLKPNSMPWLTQRMIRASAEELSLMEESLSGQPKDALIGSHVSNEKDQQDVEVEDHQEEAKERTKDKPPTKD